MNDVERLADLLAAQEVAAARALAVSLATTHPDAASLARTAIEVLATDPPRGRLHVASLYLMAGNPERACACAREVATVGAPPAIRASAAGILLAAGRDGEARPLLEQVVTETPQDRDAHINLATVAYRLGDLGGAMTGYARAFELDPSDPTPLQLLIEMFAEVGKWLGALSALELTRRGTPPPEVAVALDLASMQLLQLVASTYPEAGVDRRADDTVLDLLANVMQRGPRLQLSAAKALIDVGRITEATALVQRVAGDPELAPRERADVHYAEGLLAERARKLGAAVEHYTSALALDPTCIDAATNAVSVLLGIGTPEARTQIGPLLARVDADARAASPTLAFNEARYHARSARVAEARSCLRRVLELTGDHGDLASLARQALEELRA
jgi:tetratricopeptide (TPR) repeat protein